jgi:hypothetical protein
MTAPYLVPLPGVADDFHPETSCAPEVLYGPATVNFVNREDKFVRASFERWDALRVCRGEYLPYGFAPTPQPRPGRWPAFFVVRESPWLLERYGYEKKHYSTCYGLGVGGDVEEMVTDFEHYLLQFHDEFVEVIAGGIWFELSDVPLAPDERQPDHPLHGLGPEHVVESFNYQGFPCELRRSTLPLPELKARALLCAQPLLAFAVRLDEREARIAFRLTLRERQGKTICVWRDSLGTETRRFDQMPSEGELRAIFTNYLDEVSRRRKQRGA